MPAADAFGNIQPEQFATTSIDRLNQAFGINQKNAIRTGLDEEFVEALEQGHFLGFAWRQCSCFGMEQSFGGDGNDWRNHDKATFGEEFSLSGGELLWILRRAPSPITVIAPSSRIQFIRTPPK